MKVKRILISPALAFNLMRGTHPAFRVVADEVPEDAKLVNVLHSWPSTIELLIESETFPEVPDGQEIPILTPMFETVAYASR